MKYKICELEAFSVIGQEIELTYSQKKNIQISKQFWKAFNVNLKESYLSQYGNWVKYAFMERKNGKMFYYCAILKSDVAKEGFTYKEIKPYKYIVVEHVGSMDKIYETYTKLYKDVLPNTNHIPLQENFLHFEKYDKRFHWNKDDSIIEIWVPVKS